MKRIAFAALLLCLTLSGCAIYVPAGPPRPAYVPYAYGMSIYPHGFYWR